MKNILLLKIVFFSGIFSLAHAQNVQTDEVGREGINLHRIEKSIIETMRSLSTYGGKLSMIDELIRDANGRLEQFRMEINQTEDTNRLKAVSDYLIDVSRTYSGIYSHQNSFSNFGKDINESIDNSGKSISSFIKDLESKEGKISAENIDIYQKIRDISGESIKKTKLRNRQKNNSEKISIIRSDINAAEKLLRYQQNLSTNIENIISQITSLLDNFNSQAGLYNMASINIENTRNYRNAFMSILNVSNTSIENLNSLRTIWEEIEGLEREFLREDFYTQ